MKNKFTSVQNLFIFFFIFGLSFLSSYSLNYRPWWAGIEYKKVSNKKPRDLAKDEKEILRSGDSTLALNIQLDHIRELLKPYVFADSSPITKFELDMDPIDRLVMIEGEINLPQSVLTSIQTMPGALELPEKHQFRFSFQLPEITFGYSIKDNELTGSLRANKFNQYLKIKVMELKINGTDYGHQSLTAIDFLLTLLVKTNFDQYLISEGFIPAEKGTKSTIQLVRELKEHKDIIIFKETKSVFIKLDLAKIPLTDSIPFAKDLKLWAFRPLKVKGRDAEYFHFVVGEGYPDEAWIESELIRLGIDKESLIEMRNETYKRLSDSLMITSQLDQLVNDALRKYNITVDQLELNHKRELDRELKVLQSKLSTILSLDNEFFAADPEAIFKQTFDDVQERLHYFLNNLNRKSTIIAEALAGGEKSKREMPFFKQYISQNLLTGMSHYFRDIKIDEQNNTFEQLIIQMNPIDNALVIRGLIDLAPNYLLSMAGTGHDFKLTGLPRIDPSHQYHKGLPFETKVIFIPLNNGELGIEIDFLKFKMHPSESYWTHLDYSTKNGTFIFNFAKKFIASMLMEMVIPLAEEVSPNEAEASEVDHHKVVLENLRKERERYDFITSLYQKNPQFPTNFLHLLRNDIEGNPFNLEGKKVAASKTNLFLNKLIRYEEKDGKNLLILKPDPKAFAETLLGAKYDIQLWNLETLFLPKLGQKYLEIAVGNGVRSQNYNNYLRTRPEKFDRMNFTSNDSGNVEPVDLRMQIELSEFNRFINGIINQISSSARDKVTQELKKNKKQEYTLINDLKFKIMDHNQIEITLDASKYKRNKKGWIWARKWVTEEPQSINIKVKGELEYKQIFDDTLSQDLQDRSIENAYQRYLNIKRKQYKSRQEWEQDYRKTLIYRSSLKSPSNEVFFDDHVLTFDLTEISYIKGNPSLLDHILMFGINRKFKDKPFNKKIKVFILDKIGDFFTGRNSEVNGNVDVFGFKINRFAKVLAHDEEILIQINPRLAGASMDIHFTNSIMSNKEVGFHAYPDSNTLSIDLAVATGMALMDKVELYRIMESAKKALPEDLDSLNKEQVVELLSDMDFAKKYLSMSSDISRLSPYGRLRKVLNHYDNVIIKTKADDAINQKIQESLKTKFDVVPARNHKGHITSTGIELAYFLATGMVINSKLEKIIYLIEKYKLQRTLFNPELGMSYEAVEGAEEPADPRTVYDYVAAMKYDLNDRIILPLYQRYQKDYKDLNKLIINKNNRTPTDWNFLFFPDALFSDSVFQFVEKQLD